MTSKSKKTSKTKSETTTTASATTPDYKAHLTSSVELSRALIAEIDNLMGSDLPPAQVGKILGDIVSGFNKQLDTFDEVL